MGILKIERISKISKIINNKKTKENKNLAKNNCCKSTKKIHKNKNKELKNEYLYYLCPTYNKQGIYNDTFKSKIDFEI